MKLVLLLMALIGCVKRIEPPTCVSPCGAKLYSLGNYLGTCADFDAAEHRLAAVFPPHTCEVLGGATVSVVQTDEVLGGWMDQWGRIVGGLTWCSSRGIQVTSAPWQLGRYTHEVAHLLECPKVDEQHVGWTWQWEAIERAR